MKNKEDNGDDVLLTTKEAAAELKVSESFLAKARMSGTGPAFIQLGRSVRYSRSALEAYKAVKTRTSTSQQMLADPVARKYHNGKFGRHQRTS
jgi:excisionase family DNA binding protein